MGRRALAALLLVTVSAGLAGAAPAEAAVGPAKPTIVKLRILRGKQEVLAVLPVTIDGRRFVFALDTGAAASTIDAQAAKALVGKARGEVGAAGAGCRFVAQKVPVKHWSVGTLQLPPTTLVTANLPFGNAKGGIQGLLGSDVLSRYSTVEIDYAHALLKLSGARLHR